MDYLLDTHILIWALDGDHRLSEEVKRIINNEDNNLYFSALSVMETAIKHQKNPGKMDWSGQELYEESLKAGYYTLPMKPKHAIYMDGLKLKEGCIVNGDPFDRGLIAQAKQEGMILLSHDWLMEYYDEDCIQIV